MLAQSLASEALESAIGELRRQVREGLTEGLRQKAALELIRIATTPPEAAKGMGAQPSAAQQPAQQVVVIDLAEAGRIARNAADSDD